METKTFKTIVEDFRAEVDKFLKEHNYDRYCVQVILKDDRPTGSVTDLQGNKLSDIAFLDDAKRV